MNLKSLGYNLEIVIDKWINRDKIEYKFKSEDCVTDREI